MAQVNLLAVDWSKIPRPVDDGGASHLAGMQLPRGIFQATTGEVVDFSMLPGRTVLFLYPLTGQPGIALPEGWDNIPGARGCTPQSCSFRDLHAELLDAGADSVFGVSTQTTDYQREAAARLHLPFMLISDSQLVLAKKLKLPTFDVNGQTLLKRMALVADNATIVKVFYPVFPPDRNAGDVLVWLKEHPL